MQKTDTGPSWAQSLVSPQMSLNKFPSPYAILKNIIIRSKYDASARHPKIHAGNEMECQHSVGEYRRAKKYLHSFQ